MDEFWALFKREFFEYFYSSLAYVFMVIFLLMSVGSTFFLGGLFENNQATLESFFIFLPWLFLVFVPAVGMRLWAEERRSHTIELLFTLPTTVLQTVLAKFLAGWVFILITLSLTFPLIITVNYLGDPDNGVIFASYVASMLLAGAYLAITCFTSSISKNQVISFSLGVMICFCFVLIGWGVFNNILGAVLSQSMIEHLAFLGIMPHFTSIIRGIIDSRDVLYFFSIIGLGLALNVIIIEERKAA